MQAAAHVSIPAQTDTMYETFDDLCDGEKVFTKAYRQAVRDWYDKCREVAIKGLRIHGYPSLLELDKKVKQAMTEPQERAHEEALKESQRIGQDTGL